MMPVIRVSDTTWERMKLHAKPLEDTPDDIVRRALDALEGKVTEHVKSKTVGRPSKATAGKKLPQKEFRNPLLKVLEELGGAGSVEEIREALYPRVAARLSLADHHPVTTGEPRWWNATCWERANLVREGYLLSTSPRGRWELSEQGREFSRNLED